jgi:hypothetical protein
VLAGPVGRPEEAYTARRKATATGPYINPHWRVRHDKVDKAGAVTLRHNSRLHHISVGPPLTGTRTTLLLDDLHVRMIDRDTGELLRDLTLDPTRDLQPRGAPPGPVRPPRTTPEVQRCPETPVNGAPGHHICRADSALVQDIGDGGPVVDIRVVWDSYSRGAASRVGDGDLERRRTGSAVSVSVGW